MESSRKNKSLYLTQEIKSMLEMCAHGLLKTVTALMNQHEYDMVNASGIYQGMSLPFPFILAPNGKKNLAVLKTAKQGDTLKLVCNGQVFGEICVHEIFAIDKESFFKKLMGGDLTSKKAKTLYDALGNYAISGSYALKQASYFADMIYLIEQRKLMLHAKNISAFMLQANPIHRVHERIIRICYDTSDLLVLFIVKPHKDDDLLPFELRQKILQLTIDNYFLANRLLVIPLDDSYLFNGANHVILNAIIVQNLGCTRFIIGRNHMGLSLFYESNQIHTIFDSLQGIRLDVQILSEYVYCKQCGTIVSIISCPHGAHHHIHYHTKSMLELFNLGIPPPNILVRKEISAMILEWLYPNRFKKMEQLYKGISPSNLLDEYGDKSFYSDFLSLYQAQMVN